MEIFILRWSVNFSAIGIDVLLLEAVADGSVVMLFLVDLLVECSDNFSVEPLELEPDSLSVTWLAPLVVETVFEEVLRVLVLGVLELFGRSVCFSGTGVDPLDLRPGVMEAGVGVTFLFLNDFEFGVAVLLSGNFSDFGVALTKDPLAFLVLKDFVCSVGVSLGCGSLTTLDVFVFEVSFTCASLTVFGVLVFEISLG